jgi:hypothetical protein
MEHTKLKTALFDRGTRMRVVADAIGVSTKALYNKIEGRSRFTWNEACIIQSRFFPDISKDDLFVEYRNNL